ncbi:hypothetical protein OESDEN_11473 [Oesophagostomum dentatum]|uniref:Neurotransmitter-gated ion-channel ligand-binding domain-containing protein n=1 Tax=Oesophagostomum dentatum TaxID=61180 RepID=A0A0B1T001_OESDE|nr:hypothetical protein OESDEN_11473 [Oesophagostomum dentatum]
MAVEWTDPLLTWSLDDGNPATLKIPEENLWTPDVMLFTAISKQDLINYDRRLVVLRNDGFIVKSGPQGNTEWKLLSLTAEHTVDTSYEEGDFDMVSLGVCTLLAMALILESVTATMPNGDFPVILPGVYVLSQTILCAIAVLITSIYLIVHERAVTRSWNPPRCLVRAFLTRHYDRKVTHADGMQQDDRKSTRLSFYLLSVTAYLREVASDRRLERMLRM